MLGLSHEAQFGVHSFGRGGHVSVVAVVDLLVHVEVFFVTKYKDMPIQLSPLSHGS